MLAPGAILLTETTTVRRTRTVYDTDLEPGGDLAYFGMTGTAVEGTGRELAYEQYVESSTAQDVVTWAKRSHQTYDHAMVDTYIDVSDRYSNVDGDWTKTGNDGKDYNLTSTTTRLDTTYTAYGLSWSYDQEVRDNIRILGEGGGYILGPCHNLQVIGPPENIVAMYEAGYEYGQI